MSKLQTNTHRSLAACTWWLRIGFIGAAALAAGLLQLFDGEAPWESALVLVFFGGALAATSWRHGATLLDYAEHGPAATDTSSAWSSSASSHTERGAIGLSAPIPPQSNRRHDDFRRPTPE